MKDTKFDITLAAKEGSKLLWAERSYFLYLSLPVVILTFALTVIALRVDAHNILVGLALQIPAFAILAWYLALGVRRALLDEKIPLSDLSAEAKAQRQKAIKTAITIDMGVSLAFYFVLVGAQQIIISFENQPVMQGSFSGLMLIALFWSIRYFLLIIPASIGHSMSDFLKRVRGFDFSMRVLFLYVLLGLPAFVAYAVITSATAAIMQVNPEAPSAIFTFISIFIQTSVMILYKATVNLACTHAIDQIMQTEDPKPTQKPS